MEKKHSSIDMPEKPTETASLEAKAPDHMSSINYELIQAMKYKYLELEKNPTKVPQ